MPRRVTRRLCAQRRVYGARLNRALLKLSAVLRARILPGRLFHSGIVDTRVEFKRGDLFAFRGSSLYDVMVPSFSITDAALVSRLILYRLQKYSAIIITNDLLCHTTDSINSARSM